MLTAESPLLREGYLIIERELNVSCGMTSEYSSAIKLISLQAPRSSTQNLPYV